MERLKPTSAIEPVCPIPVLGHLTIGLYCHQPPPELIFPAQPPGEEAQAPQSPRQGLASAALCAYCLSVLDTTCTKQQREGLAPLGTACQCGLAPSWEQPGFRPGGGAGGWPPGRMNQGWLPTGSLLNDSEASGMTRVGGEL